MRRTSRRAYEFIAASGILGARRTQAYQCLFHHGPMTAQEATFQSHVPGLWKRFSELRTLGLVEELGERSCKITGMNVIEWDVTDKHPNQGEQGELFANMPQVRP